MSTFFSLYFWWIGHRAMAPTAVVQFGFATSGAVPKPSPLISGTTKGILGSYRHADELSTTWVPLGPPMISGENSSEKVPETARRQISHSCAASTEKGSTTMSPNLDLTRVPAERLAKSLTCSVGKLRSSRHFSISTPTAPEQPTMPTHPTLPAAIATTSTTTEARDAVADGLVRRFATTAPAAPTQRPGMSAEARGAVAASPTSERPPAAPRRTSEAEPPATEPCPRRLKGAVAAKAGARLAADAATPAPTAAFSTARWRLPF
mmetsp:Transcript_26640/g.47286  ORF Transcript_26640/g.47286 Transcript_26640/m.47286 type:complete len:264 (+) Transcript_26640:717-1508(+)